MRLILLALIGVLCLAFVYGDERVDLLDVADQGAAHAVNGDRETRGYGGGRYGGGGGHYGGGGGHYGGGGGHYGGGHQGGHHGHYGR